MTRQTRIAFVSALSFVAMAVLLALTPVGFVTWSPGSAHDVLATGDEPAISVSGVETYPTEGSLQITTVSVTSPDARLTLPEAVLAYWLPDRDTLPRESIYPAGKSPEQVETEEQEMMAGSQTEAVVAALRQAGVPVVERPVIAAVTVGGPSDGVLTPGDLVLSIDGTAVETRDDVLDAIQSAAVGDEVAFSVLREGQEEQVVVTTDGSNNDASVPVVGAMVGTGYEYPADVSFGIDPAIGGSSAGLVFSLAIYDKITPGPLVPGSVAGTGQITATGEVGGIGGIQQKIHGAEEAGAGVFLVPEANCPDVAGVRTDLSLVAVDSLDTAVAALEQLADPATAQDVPRCG